MLSLPLDALLSLPLDAVCLSSLALHRLSSLSLPFHALSLLSLLSLRSRASLLQLAALPVKSFMPCTRDEVSALCFGEGGPDTGELWFRVPCP
jgi:hypothetical protein